MAIQGLIEFLILAVILLGCIRYIYSHLRQTFSIDKNQTRCGSCRFCNNGDCSKGDGSQTQWHLVSRNIYLFIDNLLIALGSFSQAHRFERRFTARGSARLGRLPMRR